MKSTEFSFLSPYSTVADKAAENWAELLDWACCLHRLWKDACWHKQTWTATVPSEGSEPRLKETRQAAMLSERGVDQAISTSPWYSNLSRGSCHPCAFSPLRHMAGGVAVCVCMCARVFLSFSSCTYACAVKQRELCKQQLCGNSSLTEGQPSVIPFLSYYQQILPVH